MLHDEQQAGRPNRVSAKVQTTATSVYGLRAEQLSRQLLVSRAQSAARSVSAVLPESALSEERGAYEPRCVLRAAALPPTTVAPQPGRIGALRQRLS